MFVAIIICCWCAFVVMFAMAQPCTFKCRSGAPAIAWPDHLAVQHGCLVLASMVRAPALATLLEQHSTEFRTCCEQTDRCYGSCGRGKGECDRELLKCVVDVCRTSTDHATVDQCQPLDRLVHDGAQMRAVAKGTALFSCRHFLAAQQFACDCGSDEDNFVSRSEL
jgi:hypothetical protein